MRFCLRVLLLSALSGMFAPLHAETHFVSGTNDGLRTYAVVSRNGIEYRTDVLGARINEHLWNELTTTDRKALIRTYGWDLGSRADHFGSTTSTQMADWINQEQGWTAAADALKARHANKAFPTLEPVFGPGAPVLELADFSCTNPEIIKSADYKEASRLALEIRADYAVGKKLYDMLAQAKWDQVSIAVKTISGPLIKIIVDNFITGFITHGATAAYSELIAQVYSFENDLRDFIHNVQTPGATPPTPTELIEHLETYIAGMELTAENAVTAVAGKQARLSTLATNLKQLDAAKTDDKRSAATDVRTALTTRASTIPGPAAVPTFVDGVEGTVAQQATAYLQANVMGPKATLETEKIAAVGAVVGKYGQVVVDSDAYARDPTYPGASYAPGASNGFSSPYSEVTDILPGVRQWLSTGIPAAITTMDAYKATLEGAPADVNSVFDSTLPKIDALQSLTLGMDYYEAALGYKPSTSISFASLRDFSAVVDIAATPEQKVEDLVTELTDREAVANEIMGALPAGIGKREEWIRNEKSRYDSLRFNFENSLSYVIACVRQLDRLHSGPYFKKDPRPYKYSVDVAGINARVASGSSRAARVSARVQAVDELLRLRAEEEKIVHRLGIAQDAHINDAVEMSNFFDAVTARYQWAGINAITQDFEAVTGGTMKGMYDLWHDLVSDPTYYYQGSFGSANWIRNPGNLASDWYVGFNWNDPGPVELVSGKITEYYDLLDLYRKMGVDKGVYLAMGVAEFDVFSRDTYDKISLYVDALQWTGVLGVEWPALQFVNATWRRWADLVGEYNGEPPQPSGWNVSGLVGTSGSSGMAQSPAAARAVGPDALRVTGVGVPGVTVLLDGYLTTSTTTASDGSFLFEWIGSGDFTLSVSGQGYQFPAPSTHLTVAQQNSTADFTATETAESGYSISGKVTDSSASALQGISISLTSAAGEAQTVVTGADGVYRFFHVASGSWTIRPVAGEWTSSPATRTATVPLSATGLDFGGTAAVTGAEGVSVTLSGTGSGSVTSTPAGIACPGVCWAAFPTGTSVALTAAPQTGSVLAAWYGRCAGNTACAVPVNGAASVIAVFNSTAPPDGAAPTITVFTLPASSTSETVPLSFTAMDNVAVTGYLATTNTATPAPTDARWQTSAPAAYTFSGSGPKILFGWAKDAAGNISEAQSATVSVGSSATLTVTTQGSGSGTVTSNPSGISCPGTCSTIFSTASSVTLTALAIGSSLFTGWSGGGCGGTGTCTVTMTTDQLVTATFGPGPTLSAGLFYTLPPCRVLDTRMSLNGFNGSALQPYETRNFDVAGVCGTPSDAVGISVNLTVTNVGALGELVVFPSDVLRPNTSAISFRAGRTRANNAIVSFSKSGTTFSVFNNSAATVDFIVDVNGFFR